MIVKFSVGVTVIERRHHSKWKRPRRVPDNKKIILRILRTNLILRKTNNLRSPKDRRSSDDGEVLWKIKLKFTKLFLFDTYFQVFVGLSDYCSKNKEKYCGWFSHRANVMKSCQTRALSRAILWKCLPLCWNTWDSFRPSEYCVNCIYFNQRNFRERNFREVKISQNLLDKLSRIAEHIKFREINFHEWRSFCNNLMYIFFVEKGAFCGLKACKNHQSKN